MNSSYNSSSHSTSNSASISTSSSLAIQQSAARSALDNLLRRELKVSDPGDAKQIAQALLDRYKNDPRAAAIKREADGVPFLMSTPTTAPMAPSATSSDAEMQQAIDDVERDLHELTRSSILKDITPELQGWTQAIRGAIAEGATAARFALDPRQRDKTIAIRRTLGDYARISRLISVFTTPLTTNYRKLAQSLDEVSAVLLVKLGETLANVGLNGGRYLLQVPYGELQVRRDTVISALRNLTGSVQTSYTSNDWQRGLDAYRQLYRELEASAQGDLRSLLIETELMRLMDVLIQRSGQGNSEGVRQLGSTVQIDLERINRLIIIGRKFIDPPSPPFSAFLDSLQLFVDGFKSSGGHRLLQIARPPILFYGLYGLSVPNEGVAVRTLVDLVIQRGLLADKLDRFSQSGTGYRVAKGQVILDKILYDIDRAIDLYAMGQTDDGEPECRAAAYSYVIDAVVSNVRAFPIPTVQPLDNLLGQLRNDGALTDSSSLTPSTSQFRDIHNTLLEIRRLLLIPLTSRLGVGFDEGGNLSGLPFNGFTPEDRNLITLIRQELFIQKDMETGWENLVKTMAPNYIPYTEILGNNGVIQILINAAIDKAGDYEPPTEDLPRDPASSWEKIVNEGLTIITSSFSDDR
jgi:hypothetical protein